MELYLDHSGRDADGACADHAAQPTRGDLPPQNPMPITGRPSRLGLLHIIEGEIIPRLFLAHRDRTPHRLAGAQMGELADAEFLARLFLEGKTADIVARFQTLLEGGVRRDRLYLDLLAPVPRTLSRLWAEGKCSFDEIAVGLGCVDEVLHQMHEREQFEPDSH